MGARTRIQDAVEASVEQLATLKADISAQIRAELLEQFRTEIREIVGPLVRETVAAIARNLLVAIEDLVSQATKEVKEVLEASRVFVSFLERFFLAGPWPLKNCKRGGFYASSWLRLRTKTRI